MARGVLVTRSMSSTKSLSRMADHPRFLEVVVGRLLELVVHSIEGVRSRITPSRFTVH